MSKVRKTCRNLPHWKKDGAIYWITFRLADSLPQSKLRQWRQERDEWLGSHPVPWDDEQWLEYHQRFGERLEAWLDAGMGSCMLRHPSIRSAVVDCLMRFHEVRHLIHDAVVMPNHAHLLLEPFEGVDLSELLKGIKGASARECNRRLDTRGTFWMDESFDHIVRSERQYWFLRNYIRENPAKAGLNPGEYWLFEP